eukprot:6069610-Pleurochrysis_carterae.AAC.2
MAGTQGPGRPILSGRRGRANLLRMVAGLRAIRGAGSSSCVRKPVVNPICPLPLFRVRRAQVSPLIHVSCRICPRCRLAFPEAAFRARVLESVVSGLSTFFHVPRSPHCVPPIPFLT